MQTKIIDPIMINNIVNQYLNGEKIKNLSITYNVSQPTIWRLLKKLNCNTKRKIYSSNDFFFSDLNLPESSYWFGWMVSDGNLYKNRVSLKITDREILDNFKKSLNFSGPILEYKPKNRKKIFQLRVTSKQMVKDLTNHGCPPNKTFTAKPPINMKREFIPYFIRGFFEGDGCIYVNSKGYGQITFAGNKRILSWIKKILRKECGVYFHVKEKKNHTEIYCSGNKQIKRIGEYIYNVNSKLENMSLTRKKIKLDTLN